MIKVIYKKQEWEFIKDCGDELVEIKRGIETSFVHITDVKFKTK